MPNLPIDYFNDNNSVFALYNFGELPVADAFVENIRRAVADIGKSHIALGYALMAYAESHTFGTKYGGGYCDCRTWKFFEVCYAKFHLDKSTVSRHVNVVYRFGDDNGGLRSSYRDKSFSYLAELLPLSEQDIDYCIMNCLTVAEVRNYKLKLQSKTKPKKRVAKSVATSQQQERHNFEDVITIPLSGSANEYVRYDKFRGLTVKEVLDMLLRAEAEIEILRSAADDYDADLNEFSPEELFGPTNTYYSNY